MLIIGEQGKKVANEECKLHFKYSPLNQLN
jgi:hypothetical protein